jgi:rsbT co-antagonist protein RsbR
MKAHAASRIPDILRRAHGEILTKWLEQQGAEGPNDDPEAKTRSETLLQKIVATTDAGGDPADASSPAWSDVLAFLGDFSRSRAREGYTPSQTATFVFSLKKPLFEAVRGAAGASAETLAADLWAATEMVDQLGLYTTEVFQKGRDEIIARQRDEMLELSTPVVELWESVLALPLIGTLDSARTGVVMESLLERIVETRARIAIIDITGVPTVDTLVAQHLLKTVAAARLMGADCIISGIRPQIAQTLVHLGVALGEVVTKATLADALEIALERTGRAVIRRAEDR